MNYTQKFDYNLQVQGRLLQNKFIIDKITSPIISREWLNLDSTCDELKNKNKILIMNIFEG